MFTRRQGGCQRSWGLLVFMIRSGSTPSWKLQDHMLWMQWLTILTTLAQVIIWSFIIENILHPVCFSNIFNLFFKTLCRGWSESDQQSSGPIFPLGNSTDISGYIGKHKQVWAMGICLDWRIWWCLQQWWQKYVPHLCRWLLVLGSIGHVSNLQS